MFRKLTVLVLIISAFVFPTVSAPLATALGMSNLNMLVVAAMAIRLPLYFSDNLKKLGRWQRTLLSESKLGEGSTTGSILTSAILVTALFANESLVGVLLASIAFITSSIVTSFTLIWLADEKPSF